MSLLLLLILSFVPGALWVWYFARNDHRPEPLHMLFRAFLVGTFSVVAAAVLEQPLRPLLFQPAPLTLGTLLALASIGLIEEGAKLAATYIAVFRSRHFDEVGDGIVYAVTAALGFAAVENLFYTASFGLSVALVRAIITSLAHASFAGVFGFWLGSYRVGKASAVDVWRGYFMAAGLHALYDYMIMSRVVSPLFAIVLVYVVYRYVINKLREITAE